MDYAVANGDIVALEMPGVAIAARMELVHEGLIRKNLYYFTEDCNINQ